MYGHVQLWDICAIYWVARCARDVIFIIFPTSPEGSSRAETAAGCAGEETRGAGSWRCPCPLRGGVRVPLVEVSVSPSWRCPCPPRGGVPVPLVEVPVSPSWRCPCPPRGGVPVPPGLMLVYSRACRASREEEEEETWERRETRQPRATGANISSIHYLFYFYSSSNAQRNAVTT